MSSVNSPSLTSYFCHRPSPIAITRAALILKNDARFPFVAASICSRISSVVFRVANTDSKGRQRRWLVFGLILNCKLDTVVIDSYRTEVEWACIAGKFILDQNKLIRRDTQRPSPKSPLLFSNATSYVTCNCRGDDGVCTKANRVEITMEWAQETCKHSDGGWNG